MRPSPGTRLEQRGEQADRADRSLRHRLRAEVPLLAYRAGGQSHPSRNVVTSWCARTNHDQSRRDRNGVRGHPLPLPRTEPAKDRTEVPAVLAEQVRPGGRTGVA